MFRKRCSEFLEFECVKTGIGQEAADKEWLKTIAGCPLSVLKRSTAASTILHWQWTLSKKFYANEWELSLNATFYNEVI